MKQLLKNPQQVFAKAFLLLFPCSTILIYREPFLNGYKWEYGTLGFYGIEIIGWLFIASVFVHLIRKQTKEKRRFTWSLDRVFVAMLLVFLLYGLASAYWAIDADLAQQQSVRILFAALVFLSLPMVLTSKQIVQTLAIGALLPIGVGLYQFLSQSLPGVSVLGLGSRDVADGGVSVVQFGNERWLRSYGTFAHPNVFGGYLALLMVSVLATVKHITNRYWTIFLLLASIVLVLTMSRSAWLLMCLGMVVLIGMQMRSTYTEHKKQLYSGVAIIVVTMLSVAAMLWPLTSVRLGVTSYHEKVSILERAALQDSAMDIYWQRPWFGVGSGNMTAALIESDDTKFGYAYQPVHNVVMLLFVEYGVVGMSLLGMVLLLGYRVLFWKKKEGYVLLVIVPMLVFDHYAITSVHGMGMVVIFLSTLALSSRNHEGNVKKTA